MRFDRGWVKIHRKVVEEDIGQRGNFTLGLFVRLIRMANWKEGNVLFAGKRIALKPGQIVTGLRELSPDKDDDPYLHRVRSALHYLEQRGTIAQAISNQGRLITICNWDEYQCREEEPRKQPASEAQADRKQTASEAQLSKEDKKERRKEEKELKGESAVALAPQSNLPGVIEDPKALAKREAQSKAATFVGAYVKAYQTRFPEGRPEDLQDGKVRGQIMNWISGLPEGEKSLQRACQLVQVFFQMDTKWFATKGYDFLTFRNNLQKIGQALDSGKDPDGNAINWGEVKLS